MKRQDIFIANDNGIPICFIGVIFIMSNKHIFYPTLFFKEFLDIKEFNISLDEINELLSKNKTVDVLYATKKIIENHANRHDPLYGVAMTNEESTKSIDLKFINNGKGKLDLIEVY